MVASTTEETVTKPVWRGVFDVEVRGDRFGGRLSAVGAAKAVVSLDDLRHPELRAPTAATATLGGAEGAAQITKDADGHFWARPPSTARPCASWSTPAPPPSR
jgi:hypothetical protein